MVKASTLFAVASVAGAEDVKLTYKDCGSSSTHAKITGLKPDTISVPGKASIVGSGNLDSDQTSASFSLKVKKAGIPLVSGKGSICEDTTIQIPLGAGSFTVKGLDCPIKSGDVDVEVDLDLLSEVLAPTENTLLSIHIEANADDTSDQVICLDVDASLASEKLPPNGFLKPPPNGLIFKNATEIDMELKRNAQFEQEFLEGNYKSTLDVSYSMTDCNQICSNWCWATSASMCASAFGGGTNCQKNEAAVAGHEFQTTCDSSCSAQCDKGGTTAEIADGIKFLSGHSYSAGGVLSQSSLDSALKHGPVVLGVQWTAGGGHAITISGVSGGKYKGHDPEGYTIDVNYGGLTTYEPPYASGRYTGKWTQSVSTGSGAARKLPRGLIFKNATEGAFEMELTRNAQFEQEFLNGNYKSTLDVSYSMTNCKQECSEWCWATSATMCASAFGGGSSCNKNEEAVASHEWGLSCDSSCSSECDKPGSTDNIADGIKFLSGHSYSTGGVLSQSDLDSALQHGPVVLGVYWNGGGGHAITISGVSGGKYTGHDPEDYSINTDYSGLTTYKPPYGGTGKWAQSVYTSSGADLVV